MKNIVRLYCITLWVDLFCWKDEDEYNITSCGEWQKKTSCSVD